MIGKKVCNTRKKSALAINHAGADSLLVIPIEKIFLCLSKIGQGIANYQFRYSDFDFLQP